MKIKTQSTGGLTSSVNYNHEISGPDAGGACSGEVATANGGGNTESSTPSCKFSSTDGIRTNDALIPSGTALTTATATAESDPPDETGVTWVCFSCGKSGHAATRCPNLNDSFPFMQPGWRAEKTPVGDTSGWKCPRAEQNRQRPSDVSALHGGPGSPCVEDMLTSTKVTGIVIPVVLAGGSPLAGAVNPAWPDGPVVAGGPVGPCETPSPSSCGALEPLEHSVLIHADPAGQHAAVGTLSPSDCCPAGPAGPYVAGGSVGPDVLFKSSGTVRAFGSGSC